MRIGASFVAAALLAAAWPAPARADERPREQEPAGAVAGLPVDAPATPDPEPESEPGSEPEPDAGAHGQIPLLRSELGIPRLRVHGFADLGYEAAWIDPASGDDESQNHFAIGGMDLFITSDLGRGFHFLSETKFGFDGSAGEVDIERLLLTFEWRDWFNLALGRGHTALGYWNQAFHHGKWLYTTAERPLLYRFEDHGGILPTHYVGLEAFGNVAALGGLFSYSATLANGRAARPDDIQITGDLNPGKAVGVLLRYRPDRLPGLGIGANGYFDEIPAMPLVPARARSMREYVYGGHVFYIAGPWELIGDAAWIIHVDRVADRHHRSGGAYAQAAYRFGVLKPYYRFDWLSMAEADPYYAGHHPTAEDTRQHTVGLRWDVITFVAFKLEYVRSDADSRDVNAIRLQGSLAF